MSISAPNASALESSSQENFFQVLLYQNELLLPNSQDFQY